MSLTGTLNVSLINKFLPKKNDAFDILDWGSAGLTGTFTTVNTPNMNGRIVWDLSHLYDTGTSGGTLSVAATYYLGDIDRNSQITVADISALMAAFSNLNGYRSANGLTDPQLFLDVADVNGDGKIGNADLQVADQPGGQQYGERRRRPTDDRARAGDDFVVGHRRTGDRFLPPLTIVSVQVNASSGRTNCGYIRV